MPQQSQEEIHGPKPVEAIDWESWEQGEHFGSRLKRLSPPREKAHSGVLLEQLAPGKQSAPVHDHFLEEEHMLALEGEATLRLGDRELPIRAGDDICLPAGQKLGHALHNRSEAVFRFLIISENNPADVCIYPDSNKVLLRATQQVFGNASVIDDWQDEPASAKPSIS